MAQINTREILLFSSTQTTTGVGPIIVVPQGYTSFIATLNALTVSGSTPTLGVFIQNRLRQAAPTDLVGQDVTDTVPAVFDDLVAFAPATGTSVQVFRMVGGGNSGALNRNQTLTTNTAASGPIGGCWRVAFTIGGTTPSFAFNVVAQFIP
jgi:hypothetical protein